MQEVNKGHYLEMMDRLHVIMCTIHDHAIDHPISQKYNDVKSLLENAVDLIYEAYQITGNLEYQLDQLPKE